MAVFVNDTMTDTAGTALTSHTGETGAAWTLRIGTSMVISNANRCRGNSTGENYCYSSGLPANANYAVQADFNAQTVAILGSGITGRTSTSAETNYLILMETADLVIYKNVAGTYTELGRYATGAGAGSTNAGKLDMSGTAIKGFWAGTERISATDSSIAAAGRAGNNFFRARSRAYILN